MGNVKRMVKINGEYMHGYLKTWCKRNGMTMSNLGDAIGHSSCYIQSSIRNGGFPPAELELLVQLTGIEKEKVIYSEAPKEEKTMNTEEKLDYIIRLLEGISKAWGISTEEGTNGL